MTEKPSRAEEEYFVRQEADLRKARQEAARDAEADAERKSHYMKCPKCGFDLETEVYHELEVDRCIKCDGVWFDAGEAEQLVETGSESKLAGIFSAVVRGVRGKKPSGTE